MAFRVSLRWLAWLRTSELLPTSRILNGDEVERNKQFSDHYATEWFKWSLQTSNRESSLKESAVFFFVVNTPCDQMRRVVAITPL